MDDINKLAYAHCELVRWWNQRTGKERVAYLQRWNWASPRFNSFIQGEAFCKPEELTLISKDTGISIDSLVKEFVLAGGLDVPAEALLSPGVDEYIRINISPHAYKLYMENDFTPDDYFWIRQYKPSKWKGHINTGLRVSGDIDALVFSASYPIDIGTSGILYARRVPKHDNGDRVAKVRVGRKQALKVVLYGQQRLRKARGK